MIRVSEQALISLELKLNSVEFKGIPLGGTIVNFLYVELLNGTRKLSLIERLTDRLSIVRLLNRSDRSYFKSDSCNYWGHLKNNYHSRPIFTFLATKPHLLNINRTVLEEVGENRVLCLLRNNEIKDFITRSECISSIAADDICGLNHEDWKNDILPILALVKSVIGEFVIQNRLPSSFNKRLLKVLLLQTQRLFAFTHLLSVLQPKFILVEYDRHTFCSPLVLSAKNLSIPSFSLMHGVVNNRFGYLPLLADNLLCWGERQKMLLKSYARSDEEIKGILVTGAPQLTSKLTIERNSIIKRLKIKLDTKVVLLASNPIRDELRKKLVRVFSTAIGSDEKFKGIIRLHPSETLDFYKEEMEMYPNILFDNNQTLNFEESLAVADLCCIYNSAFGIDAITKGKSVIVINVEDCGLGQGLDLIEEGKFPSAKDESELRNLINSYFTDSAFKEEIDRNRVSYSNSYCFAYGSDAAKIALCQIEDKIN